MMPDMRNAAEPLEIEVKFHLTDAAEMRRRLVGLGATHGPKVFESNTRFDDRDGTLQRADRLLRLRQDQTCRLTFKRKPADADREVKVFHELEVAVDDFERMSAILNAIGFFRVQIYEKWRQTFSLQGAEICIDTMPYGLFLEIEGTKQQIQSIAKQLELPWEKRILANYLSIFELIRKAAQLPFSDVTFDNFTAHPAAVDPYLPLLEADRRPE
jgi:adenylate cyclase class 2